MTTELQSGALRAVVLSTLCVQRAADVSITHDYYTQHTVTHVLHVVCCSSNCDHRRSSQQLHLCTL
jgi:hypothetical protein